MIEDGASVEECIIMDNAVIGKGYRLKRVIIGKFNVLAAGTTIGFDHEEDRRTGASHVDGEGIVVLSKSLRPVKSVCAT